MSSVSPEQAPPTRTAAAPIHRSKRALRTADQPISYFMQQAVENPNLISLAAGLVDPVTLPAAEVAEAVDVLLRRPETAQAEANPHRPAVACSGKHRSPVGRSTLGGRRS